MRAEAEPRGADPLCRLPASLLEPGPPHTGAACKQSLGHRRGEDRGFKNKKNKSQKSNAEGKNIHFLPKWPDFELAARMVTKVHCPGCPTPRTTHQFNSSTFYLSRTLPQHHDSITQEQASRRREASSLTSGPSAHFPWLMGTPGDLQPHGPRCRHQGHTPQGKGFPALPTKAGWTVAGGWKEKGGGGGWQFPLACCCPCCVGGGWGPPGPGVCP